MFNTTKLKDFGYILHNFSLRPQNSQVFFTFLKLYKQIVTERVKPLEVDK